MSLNRVFGLEDIVKSIRDVEEAYRSIGRTIPPSSAMAQDIKAARAVVAGTDALVFETCKGGQTFHALIRGTLSVMRIGEVLSVAEYKADLSDYMPRLLDGFIDPLETNRSIAKDMLFELEILECFLKASIQARLDEPDVVFSFNSREYSVACKSLYSRGNVEGQFKKARKQVNANKRPGIIALNIGSLVDHTQFHSMSSKPKLVDAISAEARGFIVKNKEDFLRWIRSASGAPSRVLGVLVAFTTIGRACEEEEILLATKIAVSPAFEAGHPYALLLQTIVDSCQD